jgi:hypothetical protein
LQDNLWHYHSAGTSSAQTRNQSTNFSEGFALFESLFCVEQSTLVATVAAALNEYSKTAMIRFKKALAAVFKNSEFENPAVVRLINRPHLEEFSAILHLFGFSLAADLQEKNDKPCKKTAPFVVFGDKSKQLALSCIQVFTGPVVLFCSLSEKLLRLLDTEGHSACESSELVQRYITAAAEFNRSETLSSPMTEQFQASCARLPLVTIFKSAEFLQFSAGFNYPTAPSFNKKAFFKTRRWVFLLPFASVKISTDSMYSTNKAVRNFFLHQPVAFASEITESTENCETEIAYLEATGGYYDSAQRTDLVQYSSRIFTKWLRVSLSEFVLGKQNDHSDLRTEVVRNLNSQIAAYRANNHLWQSKVLPFANQLQDQPFMLDTTSFNIGRMFLSHFDNTFRAARSPIGFAAIESLSIAQVVVVFHEATTLLEQSLTIFEFLKPVTSKNALVQMVATTIKCRRILRHLISQEQANIENSVMEYF